MSMFQEQSLDHRKKHHHEPKPPGNEKRKEKEQMGLRNLDFQTGMNCFKILIGIKANTVLLPPCSPKNLQDIGFPRRVSVIPKEISTMLN